MSIEASLMPTALLPLKAGQECNDSNLREYGVAVGNRVERDGDRAGTFERTRRRLAVVTSFEIS